MPAFISYSRADSEFALRLARDLKAAGASVWLDQLDIKPGTRWDNAIEDALRDAPQMILILTPSSAKSDNVRDEIAFALHHNKTILPALVQDCTVPLRLQRQQRIDFRTNYAQGLAALLEILGAPCQTKSDVGSPQPHTQPTPTAPTAGAPFMTQPHRGMSVVPQPTPTPDPSYEFKTESPMAFDEIGGLERLGQAGWEMTGFLDGALQLRRPLDPQLHTAWQYHRVAGPLSPAIRASLEQNGWTFAATWSHVFHYFKRQSAS